MIKERFRAAFHRLPFTKLPAIMVKVLAMESTKKLNFFPPTNGLSPYYSPRMIIHQENLDYAKHCKISFGTYVQAHNEPANSNTQHPRSLDCIYLRYLNNKQGGHELLDLQAGTVITRRQVTPLPMTQNVIDLVHLRADKDNMPPGLKITTKNGMTLHDSAFIAGVHNEEDEEQDYTEDDDENENYDEIDEEDIANILQNKVSKSSTDTTDIQEDIHQEDDYSQDEKSIEDKSNESQSSQEEEKDNEMIYKTTR